MAQDNELPARAGDAPESQIGAALGATDGAALVAGDTAGARGVAATADPTAGLTSLLAAKDPVTGQLNAMAPTFANVLRSIGEGVAESQATMDQGLVATINKLKDTKIRVVTQVVQELDDDGMPRDEGPDLVVQEESLINYVAPNQHVWKSIVLSMDMNVSDVSTEHGMTFSRDQASVSTTGFSLPWGFGNWFSISGYGTHNDGAANNTSHTTWSSGQVRLDASLESRHTDRLPVGVELEIGPKIYFNQGPVTEERNKTYTRRSMEVTVQVQQASGAANAAVPLVMSCTQFGHSFTKGNKTDATGRAVIEITRDVPTGVPPMPATGTLTVRLGDIVRTLDITL